MKTKFDVNNLSVPDKLLSGIEINKDVEVC